MFKYKTGEQCPHCNNGTVTTNDFTQGCTWCGVVLDSVKTVPFCQIREGERFYSAYDKQSPPTLLVKTTKEDKERLNITVAWTAIAQTKASSTFTVGMDRWPPVSVSRN